MAEQLITFANDFVEEYSRFKIFDLLNRTSAILQVRGTANERFYGERAPAIRAECTDIVATTKFSAYPAVWLRPISESDFARYLPAEVAKMISGALPIDLGVAPLSGELATLQNRCNEAHAAASSFILFSKRFNLKPAIIPEGDLGIMVLLPRSSFANEVDGFTDKLKNFSDLIATLSETVTGSRHKPTLLYVATSDPIVCLATVIELAAPFLQFYTEILDVVVKNLELCKAIGNIRGSGFTTSPMPDEYVRKSVSYQPS